MKRFRFFQMKKIIGIAFLLLLQKTFFAQETKSYELSSPGKKITLAIEAGPKLKWSLKMESQTILVPSAISIKLRDGEIWGSGAKILSSKSGHVNTKFAAIHYKKDSVTDHYNQLTLFCKGDYGIVFRLYDDGAAYRFFSNKKDSLTIEAEEANFNFAEDNLAYIPYVNDPHNHDIYETSFENVYEHIRLSGFKKDSLAFAPVLVELANGGKAVISEADLEDYPGMFLGQGSQENSLRGRFAPAVLEEFESPYNDAQSLVKKRADYIARTAGTRSFPWRIIVISEQDKDLLNNDMVYRLASAPRIKDLSWIKPGKVAWDWWNDWNISHVDFRAGINTETYKYYTDFAAANHIEYILLDAGWSDGKDLMKVVPALNLPEIIDYAARKNVGVWLWAGSLPMARKMDLVLSNYSKMGIKGFKIDFMDRDDQRMVEFYYEVSRKAAENKLMLDFHGAYKPTGLQRTFPNVMNFEGVRGMENAKWSNTDFPMYDVTIPFIRMIAGPMDYTPGAMRNANKDNFRPIYAAPMSQGTRCHQLAMYIIFESPFEMLSDNPTNYRRDQESVDFIASVPTVFDETLALDGKVGEYAVLARRKADSWFLGAMGNWKEHDISINLSFLGDGHYEAEVFKDGINADREASDYKREVVDLSGKDKFSVHLSTGGGWVARIYRADSGRDQRNLPGK